MTKLKGDAPAGFPGMMMSRRSTFSMSSDRSRQMSLDFSSVQHWQEWDIINSLCVQSYTF